MSRIRTAVVGAGHLGKIHTRILKTLPEFELAVVIDPSEAARAAAAEQFGATTSADHRPWLEKVDAVVIASPTTFHHAVTRDFLEAGVHAFVEKPLTASVAEAEELVECAMLRRRTLQVGHVERFNPAYRAALPHIAGPRYVECLRESPFAFRSTDIGAVLDLMIHDIDLTLSVVPSRVIHVEATSRSLLGRHEDIVHVRLKFDDGCTAVLNASRVRHGSVRHMKIEAEQAIADIDLNAKTTTITHFDPRLTSGQVNVETMDTPAKQALKAALATEFLRQESLAVESCDAITAELQDFAQAVTTGRRPTVSGLDGLEAVRVADRILEALKQDVERPTREPRPTILRGPHWPKSAVADGLREAG